MDDAGYTKASEDGITDTPGRFVAGAVRTKNLRQVANCCVRWCLWGLFDS